MFCYNFLKMTMTTKTPFTVFLENRFVLENDKGRISLMGELEEYGKKQFI